MNLRKSIQKALKVAQDGGVADKLARAEAQVKIMFDRSLGGVDVFGARKEHTGGLLRTIVDKNSVAILFHVGATLRIMTASSDKVCYQITGGAGGRAFKFVAHDPSELMVKKDFFGVGFPYPPDMIKLSLVTGGTIARVKDTIQRTFAVEINSRITADSCVEDVRLFYCGGELAEKTELLFKEMVSGVDAEWNRFFRLLNT